MPKSLEDKIAEAKDALERGKITKQDINNVAEYSIAKRILKGLRVKQNSVDRLLAKIKKIEDRHRKNSSESPKVPSGVKEIVIDNVIEKKTNNCNIQEKHDIEKQQNVKEFDIEEEIANLKVENERLKEENIFLRGELERKNKEILEESKTVIESSIAVKDSPNNVIETVNRHEQVIKDILAKVETLEKQIVAEKSNTGTEKNPGYHGFSVCQLSSGYWQAVRRINGRPQCIYIGRDNALAQEKIEEWLEKHYPDILKEEHL